MKEFFKHYLGSCIISLILQLPPVQLGFSATKKLSETCIFIGFENTPVIVLKDIDITIFRK